MSDSSLEQRQAEFCRLAVKKAEERWPTKHQCAKRIGIAPSFWIKITKGNLPTEYSGMSERAIGGVVQQITRICDALDLDLTTSLQLLDLPEIKPAIESARRTPAGEIDLGLEELQKLVELVKLTGQPIPMAFAIKFLRMSNN